MAVSVLDTLPVTGVAAAAAEAAIASGGGFTYTVPSGTANRITLLFISWATTPGTISTATITPSGGSAVALTQLGTTLVNTTACAIFYRLNPTTGLNTFNVSWANSVKDVVTAVTLDGVNQTTPFRPQATGNTITATASTAGVTASTIGTATTDVVIACAAQTGRPTLTSQTGTSIWFATSSGGSASTCSALCAGEITPTGITQSYTATFSAAAADCIIAASVQPSGGWSYVAASTKSGTLTTTASQTVTVTANTVAGNRLLCVIDCWVQNASAVTVNSVSDAKNGTWHQDLTQTYADGAFNGRISIWSVPIGTQLLTTDNITIAFASSPGVGGGRYALLEYSGISSSATADVDVSASAAHVTNTNSPASGNTAATGAANEMDLSVYGDDGYSVTWSTAPGGTARVNQMNDITNGSFWVSDKDSGASASVQSASGTLSATSAWAMAVATYKLTGAAPANPVDFGVQVYQAVPRAAVW